MNLAKSWDLQIDPGVFKSLNKLPRRDAERIFIVIKSLKAGPYAGDIQKMKGERSTWRRRVGAFRIFFELVFTDKIVYVFRVERRGSKTY